jgi:endonuclease I
VSTLTIGLPYSEIIGEKRVYGQVLGFKFSTEKRTMLEHWSAIDPVSDGDCKLERNKRICKAQGSGNYLVSICD